MILFLILALKEVKVGAKRGKNVPDKGKSKQKGLEQGVCLVLLRFREKTSMVERMGLGEGRR